MYRLVVRNPATGAVEIDQTTNMMRILGSLDTGGVAGSLNLPGFAQGQPWTEYMMIGSASYDSAPPTITVSGTTLSWTYPSGSQPAIILYGVS